jgi:adenosylmethionine-8-amino-7-oxononanoate aminotransferase
VGGAVSPDSGHLDPAQLQADARRHLWMHFSRLGALEHNEIPIFTRGTGTRLYDVHGRSFLDGLASLFVVQVGHGRADIAEAGRRQAQELGYYPLWSAAHPAAVELATRLAALAPGDLNRVFFTTGGSEAVESAWKLARAYFKAIGHPGRTKVIARDLAYHGTTFGALAITGLAALRDQFEPGMAGTAHVANTNRFRSPFDDDVVADDERFAAACADAIENAILAEGPETVAAVFLEPMQNTGGCFVPPPGYFDRVRAICDRHGVLLVSDEVICAFGRLGTWFGAERYGYLPDMVTFAKGVTSGYAPLAGVICRDFLAEPFRHGEASFAHGITFGGHPVSCAVALANLTVLEDEGVIDHVAAFGPGLGARLEGLRDLPVVGDVRGDGFFWAVELVKDPDHPTVRFTPEERTALMRGLVAPRLFEEGLVCRADDRVDPVVQVSPVLVCGDAELDEIEATLRTVLTEAGKHLSLT